MYNTNLFLNPIRVERPCHHTAVADAQQLPGSVRLGQPMPAQEESGLLLLGIALPDREPDAEDDQLHSGH